MNTQNEKRTKQNIFFCCGAFRRYSITLPNARPTGYVVIRAG